MTLPMLAHHNNRGFTLIETIIYIGLFAIMFTGIFMSVFPLFTSAERTTRNIVTEGETAFILAKIHYALADTITSADDEVLIPAEGASAHELRIAHDGTERYRFLVDTTNAFCSVPLVCKMLTLSEGGGDPLPLNAQRVQIEDFTVTHMVEGGSRYLDITFMANGEPVGPVRYYLHF